MSTQMNLFIVLITLSFGVGIIVYLLFSNYRRKQTFHSYLTHEDNKQEPLEENNTNVFNSLISQFTSSEEEINKKFADAGLEGFRFKRYYMHIKYGVFLIGAISFYFLSTFNVVEANTVLIAGVVWFIFCVIAPDSYLAYMKKRLIAHTSSQLPYLLDLLAICVQTGMTLESALSYLANEMKGFDKNLAKLLAKTNERSRVVGLERSLDELYLRIPSPEMRSFVMTLKQSLQYGSSIYSVLTTLAADIRAVNMLHVEEKIGKLAAKMSIPLILFIMMPIVFIIVAPGIMRLMADA
ncbi:MAG: type II secretion system F family protein [Vibrio gallaecicus]